MMPGGDVLLNEVGEVTLDENGDVMLTTWDSPGMAALTSSGSGVLVTSEGIAISDGGIVITGGDSLTARGTRQAPFEGSALGVHMATGAPVLMADGTPALMPSGSPAVDSGSGCICCPETHECDLCGACCFSSLSLASIEWHLSPGGIVYSSGDEAEDWWNHTESDLPRHSPPPSGYTAWNHPDFGTVKNHVALYHNCTGNTSVIETDGLLYPGGDWYQVEITLTEGGAQLPTDCCGYEGEAWIFVEHFDAEENRIGYAGGMCSLKIEIKDNECCKDGESTCDEVQGDCDGVCTPCQSNPPARSVTMTTAGMTGGGAPYNGTFPNAPYEGSSGGGTLCGWRYSWEEVDPPGAIEVVIIFNRGSDGSVGVEVTKSGGVIVFTGQIADDGGALGDGTPIVFTTNISPDHPEYGGTLTVTAD